MSYEDQRKEKKVKIYSIDDQMSPTVQHYVNQYVASEKFNGRTVKKVQVTMYGKMIHEIKAIS